jgi:hypothetical protein
MTDQSESEGQYLKRRLDRLVFFVSWTAAIGVGVLSYLYFTEVFRMNPGGAAGVAFIAAAFLGYYFRERLSQ